MSDSTPAHVRVISLILALSVVGGGWLALEYVNRQPTPSERTPATPGGTRAAQGRVPPQLPQEPAYLSTQPSGEVAITYKCLTNGQVSFGDQPCPANSKLLSTTMVEKSPAVDDDRPARMRRLAARMEADRLERERTQRADFVAAPTTDLQAIKSAQCKSIDDQIALIDARMRQPHDAQTGDYFNGKRKKLTDQRFDLGC